jgi:predicted glycosyltransferase
VAGSVPFLRAGSTTDAESSGSTTDAESSGSTTDAESSGSTTDAETSSSTTDAEMADSTTDASSRAITNRGPRRDPTSSSHMRVHFDVTHPAHVHLFRHAIESLAGDDHAVGVTAREKEVTTQLLDAFGIEHEVLSRMRAPAWTLGPEWGLRTLRTVDYVRRFDPDVVVSQLNPAAVGAAALTRTPSVVFHDSETAGRLADVLAPLTEVVCSPKGVQQDLGGNHRFYEGFHELAYLHPNRFEPDDDLLAEHGADPDEPYAVLRFVSMGAYHDVGEAGVSPDQQRRLVSALAEHGPVYVSSEDGSAVDDPAEPVPVPPEAIHHLLANASVFVGDSDTMAIEAAVLGTPSVRVDSFGDGDVLGCFDELERYGLVHSTTDGDAAIDRAVEIAGNPAANEQWERRRDRLLEDKLDVSSYVLDTIREVAA